MRHSPGLFLFIAICAAVAGVFLPTAVRTGAGVSVCISTASIVLALSGIAAAFQYVRMLRESPRFPILASYFDSWPRELTDLLSSNNNERRLIAAARLGRMGSAPDWPYRRDAIAALRFVVETETANTRLLPSALGALGELRAPEVVKMLTKFAYDTSNAEYLRWACISGLRRFPAGRELCSLAERMESEEIELLTISALEHAVLLTDPHQRGQVAMCVNKVAVEARGRHWNRVLRFADAIDVQVDAPASPQSP